jgi:hypothetical protein
VLGTVQGDVDTVPYHAQRLLKSAKTLATFPMPPFPDWCDQLSVRALSSIAGAAKTEPGPTSLAQRFPAIFLTLKTTKMTWLMRLQMPPKPLAEPVKPAWSYG